MFGSLRLAAVAALLVVCVFFPAVFAATFMLTVHAIAAVITPVLEFAFSRIADGSAGT